MIFVSSYIFCMCKAHVSAYGLGNNINSYMLLIVTCSEAAKIHVGRG